VPIWET